MTMLASILLASALAAGPVRIRVEIKDSTTLKPLPGAQVTLRAQSGPAPMEVQGTTGADGRVWLDVQHLDFAPVEIVRDGYVAYSQAKPLRDEIKFKESRTPRGPEEAFWEVWLVPRSWWDAHMKALTREQAVAQADGWGRECGAPATSVEYFEKERTWEIKYPCLRVMVKATDGHMSVIHPKPVTASPLYSPEDAVADAMSGPLEFVGIDKPEGHQIPECLFRNQKVLVLDRYCTTKEINTTGIQILHPERGVIYFYAESKEPITGITRDDYREWRIETRDPYRGARVDMTFDEYQAYEVRRLQLTDQGCSAGFAMTSAEPHCLCRNKTPEIQQWWTATSKPLLKRPPETWYRLVRTLRPLSARRGRPDPRRAEGEEGPKSPMATPVPVPAGNGPARVIVEVYEYYTQNPVVGARVTIREKNGTQELTAATGGRSKALFNTPHANFEVVNVEGEGLVPYEELRPIWPFFRSLEPRRAARADDEVVWEIGAVRRSWLDSNVKVASVDKARPLAAEWGSACGPGEPSEVRFTGSSWLFTYPCLKVSVDVATGEVNAYRTTQDTSISAAPPYPPEEALADALGTPLRHVGTTVWYGNFSIPACVWRNDTVLVVSEYCTIKEINPTAIFVFHPQRGVATFRARGDRD
jgi:hypothetical protein